jgi:hypothetical protein
VVTTYIKRLNADNTALPSLVLGISVPVLYQYRARLENVASRWVAPENRTKNTYQMNNQSHRVRLCGFFKEYITDGRSINLKIVSSGKTTRASQQHRKEGDQQTNRQCVLWI